MVGRALLFVAAILQHKSCDTMFGQPLADFIPFVFDSEIFMSAAGRYDDRRAGCLIRGWQINGEGRIVDIGDPARQARHRTLGVVAMTFGAWRAILPEWHLNWFFGHYCRFC